MTLNLTASHIVLGRTPLINMTSIADHNGTAAVEAAERAVDVEPVDEGAFEDYKQAVYELPMWLESCITA